MYEKAGPSQLRVVITNTTINELTIRFEPQGTLSREAEQRILIESRVMSFVGKPLNQQNIWAMEAAIYDVIGRLEKTGALRWSYNRDRWVIDADHQEWSPS